MPLSCPRAPLLLLSLPSFLLPATPHGTKHNQRLSLSFALPLRRRRRRRPARPLSSSFLHVREGLPSPPRSSVRPSVRPKPLLLLTPAPLALSLPLPPALCPSPLRRRPPSLSFALLLQHERWTQRRRGRQRQTVQCSGSVK